MKTFFLLLAAAFLFLQTGKACTIIVAGKKAIPQRKHGSRVLRHTAS